MTCPPLASLEAQLREAVHGGHYADAQQLVGLFCAEAKSRVAAPQTTPVEREKIAVHVAGVLEWARLMVAVQRSSLADALGRIAVLNDYTDHGQTGAAGIRLDG